MTTVPAISCDLVFQNHHGQDCDIAVWTPEFGTFVDEINIDITDDDTAINLLLKPSQAKALVDAIQMILNQT